MSTQHRSLCCHVSICVTIICCLEITSIVISYLTNLEHPLMTCKSHNVSVRRPFSASPVPEIHRICTTDTPLLAWIILHMFTDFAALVAIQTVRYSLLLPFIFVTLFDILMTSAYVVVMLCQILFGDYIDKSLLLFVFLLFVFKSICMTSGRSLYWYLQWKFDNKFSPRSALVTEDGAFQF